VSSMLIDQHDSIGALSHEIAVHHLAEGPEKAGRLLQRGHNLGQRGRRPAIVRLQLAKGRRHCAVGRAGDRKAV